MTVIGIDLGTSFCVLSTIQRGAVTIIRNDLSERLTPALVAFSDKERLIGDAALTQIKSNYKNTCRNIKQMLGLTNTDTTDLAEENMYALAPIEFTNEEEGFTAGYNVQYKNQRQTFSATRCLSALLTKLRGIAEKAVDTPVKDVVISVPGWASDKARNAIVDAAEIAGLNCLRVMNEHAAVALDYGIYRSNTFNSEKASRVAFIGVGHATTTVCIVDYLKGKGTVVAVSSNKHLGGRNIDRLIVEHFANNFKEQHGISPLNNLKAVIKLEDVATKAKKILSANTDAPFNVECLLEDRDITGLLQRSELEHLCQPLREKLLQQLQSIFSDNGLSPEDIQHIEIIGGCTRSPWIQETITMFFNNTIPLSRTLSMDETVARGCALQAAMLDPRYKVREFELIDSILEPIMVSYPVITEQGVQNMKTNVLFNKGSNFGIKKWLTFNRDTDFELHLHPGNDIILTSLIQVPKTEFPGSRRIRVSVRLSLHGTVSIETAQLLLDEEVEEPVKEKWPVPPAPDAPEGEPQKFEEVEVMKKRVKTKRIDCSVITKKTIGYLESHIIDELKKQELLMIQDDLEQQQIKELMNDLEAYIYRMRDNMLDTSGSLYEFAHPDTIQQASEILTAAQDWLYDYPEGTKEMYLNKLNELKNICDPVEKRYNESLLKKEQINITAASISELRSALASPEWLHVDPTKMSFLVSKIELAERFLVQTSNIQQPLYVDSQVTSKQIIEERENLLNFSKTVLVPKIEDTVQTPTPTETQQTEQKPDINMEDCNNNQNEPQPTNPVEETKV